MKRALVAVVLAMTACGDDDDGGGDIAEPSPTTAAAAVTSTSPPAPGSLSAAPSSAPVAASTTSVDPDIDPAVALTEVVSLDGGAVDLAWRDGDEGLYVVEQPGRVTRIAGDGTATALDITDLTDADGERGLLGLAFDPTSQLAYVNYTDSSGWTIISEHPVGADGTFGTGDQARIVLEIEQPYANHNGGDVAFGPDGMLYIGMGDGGSAGDPQRRATDPASLLGKMLRIDPSADGAAYSVPPDNPFTGVEGTAPEIWSTGLRNPWRFSFDRQTGDLWIGDVGQNAIEEIDVAPATGGVDAGKGLFFGWSVFEGDEPYNDDVDPAGHVPPIFTYTHDEGCSISGGVRARGGPIPELAGWYVYADYCAGQVWALQITGEGGSLAAGRRVELGEVPSPTAVVDGPGGEVYVLSAGGGVYRLDPA